MALGDISVVSEAVLIQQWKALGKWGNLIGSTRSHQHPALQAEGEPGTFCLALASTAFAAMWKKLGRDSGNGATDKSCLILIKMLRLKIKTKITWIIHEWREVWGLLLSLWKVIIKKRWWPTFLSAHRICEKTGEDIKIAELWVLINIGINQWKKLGDGFWWASEKQLPICSVGLCWRVRGLMKLFLYFWAEKNSMNLAQNISLDYKCGNVALRLMWEHVS